MVAHRLSTVTQCTRIAAVYRGRVLEQVRSQWRCTGGSSCWGCCSCNLSPPLLLLLQGTHAQLLEAKRYYAHLWESSTAAQ